MTRMLFRFIVFGVLALTVGCTSTVTRKELAEEYFNLGNAFFQSGDLNRSYEAYQRALAISDDLPAAGYNLARLYIDREEFSEADRVLDELLQQDPENTLLLETKAFALYRAGEIHTSLELFHSVLNLSPARTTAAYNLALVYMAEQNPTEAYAVLRRTLEFAENDAEYVWLYAETAYRAGEESESLKALETYSELSQSDEEARNRLAQRYYMWEFYLQAIEHYEDIVQANPDTSDPAFYLGAALLLATSEVERGFSLIDSALEDGFDDVEAIERLAFDLADISDSDLGRLLDLAEEYRLEIDLEPDAETATETELPEDQAVAPGQTSGNASEASDASETSD